MENQPLQLDPYIISGQLTIGPDTSDWTVYADRQLSATVNCPFRQLSMRTITLCYRVYRSCVPSTLNPTPPAIDTCPTPPALSIKGHVTSLLRMYLGHCLVVRDRWLALTFPDLHWFTGRMRSADTCSGRQLVLRAGWVAS